MTHEPENNRSREYLTVLLASLLITVLSLIHTYPIALRPDHWYFLVHRDPAQFVWAFWWMKKALIELQETFYFTDLLFYPTGTSLAFQAMCLSNAFFSVPLQSFLSLPVTYNILSQSAFVLSGIGMYSLCNYLTGDRASSLAAGIIYAFAPLWSFLSTIHYISIQWFPFFLLFFLKFLSQGTPRSFLLSVIFFLLLSLTCWYYSIFTILIVLIFLVYSLLRSREMLSTTIRLHCVRIGVLVVGCVLAVLPFAYPLIHEGFSGDPSLEMISDPGRFQILGYQTEKSLLLWPVIFGYGTLILAGLSVLRCRKKPLAVFWMLLGFIFLVLTLGDHLRILGKEYDSFPLPKVLLNKIPFVKGARNPSRYIVIAHLSLSILSAYGISSLRQKAVLAAKKPITVSILPIVLPLVIFLEFLPGPHPVILNEVPAYYTHISRDPDDCAVLELPVSASGEAGIYMYYQTIHGKRFFGGHLSRSVPHEAGRFLEGFLPYQLYHMANKKELYNEAFADGKKFREAIDTYRIKYVVLHKSHYPNTNKVLPVGNKGMQNRTTRRVHYLPFSIGVSEVFHARYPVSSHELLIPYLYTEEIHRFLSQSLGGAVYEDEMTVVWSSAREG